MIFSPHANCSSYFLTIQERFREIADHYHVLFNPLNYGPDPYFKYSDRGYNYLEEEKIQKGICNK